MREIKIVTLVLICLFSQTGCLNVEKKTYKDGDLRYLVDTITSNRKLSSKMPELSRLKYMYIFEYSNHQSIAILLDVRNRTVYLDNSYYILRLSENDYGIILSEEETSKFVNTISEYDLQKWRNYSELSFGFGNGNNWEISLEFEDMIIYHYEGKQPENYYEFLLKWYQLIDECSPGILYEGPYNTQIYDSYKKELEQKNKVGESQE